MSVYPSFDLYCSLSIVAAAVKELQSSVIQFLASYVRHFTLAMVAQQAGPFLLGEKSSKLTGTDPYVLIGLFAYHTSLT